MPQFGGLLPSHNVCSRPVACYRGTSFRKAASFLVLASCNLTLGLAIPTSRSDTPPCVRPHVHKPLAVVSCGSSGLGTEATGRFLLVLVGTMNEAQSLEPRSLATPRFQKFHSASCEYEHVCLHTHIYTHIHAYIHTSMHTCIYTYMCVYMYTHTHVLMYFDICVYVYIFTHICLYICLFKYTHLSQ